MPKLLVATGHAFNLTHLFYSFNNKKLKINCKLCAELIGDAHREKLAYLIFRECYKLILKDVICNRVAFLLPTGALKSEIAIDKVKGEAFKNLRRGGKWQDVDFLKSYFTGYRLVFKMYTRNRTPRLKPIHVTREFRDLITEKTNTGLSLMASKEKTIKNYYEDLYLLFPEVPKMDIQRICKFGFKLLYLLNSYGGDVIICDGIGFWSYIGYVYKDSLSYFRYYIRKLSLKLRILYRRKKIPWDGYYYFALSKVLYDSYLEQKNKRGRPRKKFKYGTLMLYLIFDECNISNSGKRYIFRVPFPYYIKHKLFVRDFVSDKAELIITREPLKFKDILVNDNEYEVL